MSNDVLWSSLSTTAGNAPGEHDIIVVEHEDRLILDAAMGTTPVRVKGILLYGEFTVEDANVDLALMADWILVVGSGRFKVGDVSQPFASRFTLTLTGDANEVFSLASVINEDQHYVTTGSRRLTNCGHTFEDFEQMVGTGNYSFLMAMGAAAVIEMHTDDALEKKSWTQLDATAESSGVTLTLAEETGWEVGDRIVVASTDFDLNQAEEFVIVSSASNGRSITLDRPLRYMHYGEIETYADNDTTWTLDMRAEVGLLNRDVKVRGDVTYDPSLMLKNQPDQYGGHTMVMMGGKMYLSGIEFEHMGQAGILGRYPMHWHMRGDATDEYIEYCSSHHAFNKGMTVHGTHNTRVEGNVVYENLGHSYFLEDGGEEGNQFLGNLAINARKPVSRDAATERDDFNNPSSFWMENGLNIHRDNHAAGSEGAGFFFDLRGLNGLSRSRQYRANYQENREGPTDFQGNSSHSNRNQAFFLNHAGYVRSEAYKGTDAHPQVVAEDWEVNGFTAYKSRLGLYIRGIGGNFFNVMMGEIDEGTRFRLNQAISHALIVGRTNNIGDPSSSLWDASEGRTMPYDGEFVGHQLYDGPGGLNHVHFAGFPSGSDDHPIKESNAVHKSSLHYVNRLSFAADIPFSQRMRHSNPLVEARGIVDIDGSLSGVPGAALIGQLRRNNEMNLTENGAFNADWDGNINPDISFGSMRLRQPSQLGQAGTFATLSRSDGPATEHYEVNANNHQFLFAVGDAYTYKLRLTSAPAEFQFYVNDVAMGEGTIFEIEGIDRNARLSVGHEAGIDFLPEAPSLEALQAATTTTVFRDRNSGNVFIKFVAQMRHGWLFPQPRMTLDNREIGGVLVNVNQDDLIQPVSSVTVDPSTLLLPTGDLAPLTASVTPADASTQTVSWSSSDEAIATVDENGMITGVMPGTATITATTHEGGLTAITAVTVVSGESTPYGGTPWAIPGTIQAEDYNEGGIGVAYFDNTTENAGGAYRVDGVDLQTTRDAGGGYNVGWVRQGEWLAYTVDVQAAGEYQFAFRVASRSNTGELHVEMDSVDITGSVSFAPTGDWQRWTTVLAGPISLAAGEQTMRIHMDANSFNLNYVEITPLAAHTAPLITETMTLAPIHDAYLQNGTRYDQSLVRVENSSRQRIGYFRFDLSQIEGEILDAQLELHCVSDPGEGGITISLGDNSAWTESDLSTSNAPSAVQPLANQDRRYDRNRPYTWTLGTLPTGGNALNLVMSKDLGDGTSDVAFASKEYGTPEYRPQLTLTVEKLDTTGAPTVVWDGIEAVPGIDDVRVNWWVAAEQGIELYQLERSIDGVSYQAIDLIPSLGRTNDTRMYGMVDPSPLSQYKFYRMRASGANGYLSFSEVVEVGDFSALLDFSIYPNPLEADQLLHVDLEVAETHTGPITVSVFNYQGAEVLQQTDYITQTSQTLSVDINSLQAGLYILSVHGQGWRQSERFEVQ